MEIFEGTQFVISMQRINITNNIRINVISSVMSVEKCITALLTNWVYKLRA